MVEQRARRQRWFVGLIVLTLAFVLSGAGINSATAQAPPEEDFLSGEILVKFEPGTRGQTISDVHRRIGGQVEEVIRGIGVQVVGVPEGQEQRLVTLYERNPNVRYAELNGLYQAFDHQKPDDLRVEDQWQYHNTGQTGGTSGADIYAFEAWHTILGNSSVPIAILDTGIKASHEDLNNKVTKSKNFATCGGYTIGGVRYGGSPCAVDDNHGHGTHVAGSAAANSNNGVGVAGTCRDCSLFNAKVLDDDGSGAYSWIANGITWSANEGAKVISMSLGGSSSSDALRDAVDYAWGKGAVVVAAAGNDNTSSPSYPAYYPKVIAVGATDHKDLKASYSNYGDWVDVAAPGSAILSTTIDSTKKYGKLSGTSMSTPHVAGVAGLVWSAFPNASNQQVRDKIEASIADKTVLANTGPDWSKARINACKAVGGTCIREDKTAPTVTSVSPTDGASGVSRETNVSATFSEAMDPASLTTETVALVKDGTSEQIGATVSVSSDGKTVTLDPSASLAYGTKYRATVRGGTSGAKDKAGNPLAADKVWSFTTESGSSGDTTAPTISSVTPADGATSVSRGTNVSATFSEEMNRDTLLAPGTFTLVRASDGTAVSATVTVSSDGKTVTLDPSAYLSSNTKYRAKVTTGAKDKAGNALQAEKVWTFTTWYF